MEEHHVAKVWRTILPVNQIDEESDFAINTASRVATVNGRCVYETRLHLVTPKFIKKETGYMWLGVNFEITFL